MKYLIICMTLKLRVLILMLYKLTMPGGESSKRFPSFASLDSGVKLDLKNIYDLRY